jgi:hypothetical protein
MRSSAWDLEDDFVVAKAENMSSGERLFLRRQSASP